MNTPRLLGFGTSMVLHAGAISAVLWGVSQTAPASVKSAAPTPMALVVADPHSVNVPAGDFPFGGAGAPSMLQIGGFSFDYRKIAQRPTRLFPFLTQPLSLEHATVTLQHGAGGLTTASLPTKARRAIRPLTLSDPALQRLVDKTWSRRERWGPFRTIAALVTAHGPDDERLVALLRAYRDQNVLQPYLDTASREALLWVTLGIAADHGDFIDFVGEYAARHPSSKVTTELLFLLDELAQGSFDALAVLLDTRGHDLWWTRESNREAYDLFEAIQRHYRVQLRKKNMSREALGAYYDNVRLRILAHIVRTTPARYRIDDALFLSGSIYWKQRRTAEALSAWRRITVDPEDVYAEASAAVRVALHGTVSGDGRDVDAAAINRILGGEHARWLASSARRLARFGHSLDTF